MVSADFVSQVCVCVVCRDPLDAELHCAMCLPCGHTLGKQCHTKVSGKCPECFTVFTPSALPINHLLHSLLSKLAEPSSSSHTQISSVTAPLNSNQTPEKCARCEEKPSQIYCKDCDDVYCKDCDCIIHIGGKLRLHKRLEASCKPMFVSLDCDEHKGERVKLFCYDCVKCVCRDCSHSVLGKHSAHSMGLLEDAVQKASESLAEQCSKSVSSLKVFAESLDEVVGKADACLEECEKQVFEKWAAVREMKRRSKEARAKAESVEAQIATDVETVLSLKPRPVDFLVAYEKLRVWLTIESKDFESLPNKLIPFLETLNKNMPHSNGFNVSLPGFRFDGLSLNESFSPLLSVEQSTRLLEWFGAKKQFELLFKASKDGFEAADFHRLCDGKGSTLVLVKSESGHLFGGFTSKSWTSAANQYVNCNGDSWLFSLTNPSNRPHKFLPIPQKYSKSIYCHPSYGPTFGEGHDFQLSSSCQSKGSSYSNLGHSYDVSGLGLVYQRTAQTFFCGSHKFIVSDYEVYRVI